MLALRVVMAVHMRGVIVSTGVPMLLFVVFMPVAVLCTA